MSPYQNMYFSIPQICMQCFSLFARSRTRQQRNTYLGSLQKLTYRLSMLNSQNLRWSHDAGLISIIHRKERTHQGNQGFTTSNVPL